MLNEDKQVKALCDAIASHALKIKGEFVKQVTEESHDLLVFIEYLRQNVSRKIADHLLDGVQGALIEVAGFLSLGLVRPAIFSIRTQVELLFAWMYFNDHPVEWRFISTNSKEFPMRSHYLKYMKEYSGGAFDTKLDLLSKHPMKAEECKDIYALLSAHVHSTSSFSTPVVGSLSDLVQTDTKCKECIGLQAEVSRYLTDVLTSWYISKWHDFPSALQESIRKRLSAAQLKNLCS